MGIEKLQLMSGINTQPKIQQQPSFKGESEYAENPQDKEKSNASKLMLGATALAGVVALGIAGYKGHLGKGIQKFLGGAEKAIEKESANIQETVAKAENVLTKQPNILSVQNVIDEKSGEKITRTVFDDGSHIDYFPSQENSMRNSYSLSFDKNQKIIEKIIYKTDGMTVLERIPGEKL